MKMKWIISPLVVMALVAGCMTEKAEHHNQEAKLMAQAKVSRDAAEKIALTKVPNGTIKDSELEKEHGHLQWSFDVASPGSKDITEVNIDAVTGDVISAEKESAEDAAKEAAEDSAKAKKKDKD